MRATQRAAPPISAERQALLTRAAEVEAQRQAAREAEMRAKASRERAAKVMEELARASAKRAQAEVLQSQAQQQQQNGKARGDAPPEPAEDMVERIFGVSPDGQTADGHNMFRDVVFVP